jgi:hypothetical protein
MRLDQSAKAREARSLAACCAGRDPSQPRGSTISYPQTCSGTVPRKPGTRLDPHISAAWSNVPEVTYDFRRNCDTLYSVYQVGNGTTTADEAEFAVAKRTKFAVAKRTKFAHVQSPVIRPESRIIPASRERRVPDSRFMTVTRVTCPSPRRPADLAHHQALGRRPDPPGRAFARGGRFWLQFEGAPINETSRRPRANNPRSPRLRSSTSKPQIRAPETPPPIGRKSRTPFAPNAARAPRPRRRVLLPVSLRIFS